MKEIFNNRSPSFN